MAHKQQIGFVSLVRGHLGRDFTGRKVLEVGSYDVNGSIRNIFSGGGYVGVDLVAGPNIDVVSPGEDLCYPDAFFDVAISCECFEHNPKWAETFLNMYRMTKEGGVVIITCATKGRVEHGTERSTPYASPGTQCIGSNYYKNLTKEDFQIRFPITTLFGKYVFFVNKYSKDLCFVGKKRGENSIFNFQEEILLRDCAKKAREIGWYADIDKSYPKIMKWVFVITQLPLMFLGRVLPDRYFQEIAISYNKLIAIVKAPIVRLFRK